MRNSLNQELMKHSLKYSEPIAGSKNVKLSNILAGRYFIKKTKTHRSIPVPEHFFNIRRLCINPRWGGSWRGITKLYELFVFLQNNYGWLLLSIYLSKLSKDFRLKSNSHLSKKNCFICFNESPLKMIKNDFYFILKAVFILKIFKCLCWLYGHVGKTAWLERWGEFQNLWHQGLVKKQLQYTYCQIYHEVKATRQWHLVS